MPQAARNPPGLVFKRHNIRIWCHECDMGRLQRVVWEGHGTQLLSEVSSQPIVKRFLEAVPYIMNTIRDIHNAVIQNDLEGLIKLTADPVLPRVFSSRDINNMTALHKAAGLGHCGILKYIVEKYPQGINDVDNDGRTPLHYAATVKDEQHTYNTLVGLGADESVVDNRNKSPAYYVNRPQEIDKSTLKILPDAPRTPSSAYPTSWDWKLLDVEHTADINKKHRKKKASNENISSKNNTSTLSEPFENRINLMKGSSTHEHINTLPELDDTDKPNIPNDVEEENAKNIKASDVIEENNHEEVNVDKEKDTTIESLEFDKNLTAEAIDSEHLQVPSTTDEKKIEDEDKSLLLNKEENNDEEKCDTKDIIETENENSTHNDTNEKDTEKERINEIEDDNEDHNIDENKNESTNPNEQVGNEQFKNDDSKETDGHKDSFNNEDQTNDKNPIDAMCDSEEQLDKGQEDITDINEHRTSNGDVRTEEQETESHDINSDMNVEDKNSGANGPEGNNNSDRNEDDDDVQVQEKLHIEHNGLILNDTTEISEKNVTIRDQINNSSFGKQNYGRNTQESLIEGIISGDAEQDSQDASMTQKDGSVHGDILIVDNEIDPEVTDLINSANMEMLATLVLNGEGSRLIGRRSHNAELQAFLENVPTYMQKINRVHMAARGGNIRDLQTALDRRKFAIARDPISPNGATPLHVATVFGKTNIIKYLGGRFPETLSAVDFEGRTALHYAAVIPDNGHYYNLLQQLGANEKDLDDNGRSAKDYLNNPNLLPYEQLIADYGMSNEIAQNMLSDKGENHAANGHMDIPVFYTEEGRYLAKSLGDPLIKGLTEVANVKPKDPVAFLASFLHHFPESEKPRLNTQETNLIVTSEAPELENERPPPASPLVSAKSLNKQRSAARTATLPQRPIDVIALDPKSKVSPRSPEIAFSSANRDEHGQSMLHFAAARTHTNNALFQLLQESDVSLGYRDELYRTARDVSIQANVPENTVEIDKWVLHLAARGKSEKIMELLLQGYDHIIDIVDSDGTSITEIVSQRGDMEMSDLLASIPAFEESRESLHGAARRGDVGGVRDIVAAAGGRTVARAHSSFGRTALHVAVLAQHEHVVAYLAETCPELLRIGDNLERTPLHYAMGVEKIESLSRILIRAGSKRVLKDLKGRQPSYYFMNKSDILRLKEEEEAY